MSEPKEALVFDIQRFSLHDGPGIRTLVFFKGCSLACKWCSNPEGISFDPEIRNNRRLCVGCGDCVRNCPFGATWAGPEGISIDRERCQKCGICVENCKAKALSWWGEYYTIPQLYDRVRRDVPFYESSGGGLTLGGGDPLLQNQQAVELLRLCKENGIHTAIETAGNYPWKFLENVAPYCDTIHFDLKGWDRKTCQRCIRADNKQILANLKKLSEWIAVAKVKPDLIVRVPLLPDDNFTQKDFEEAALFLAGLQSITQVEVLPFHNLGEFKYVQLERPYQFYGSKNLKVEAVEEYKTIFKQAGLPVVVTSM